MASLDTLTPPPPPAGVLPLEDDPLELDEEEESLIENVLSEWPEDAEALLDTLAPLEVVENVELLSEDEISEVFADIELPLDEAASTLLLAPVSPLVLTVLALPVAVALDVG